MTTSPVEPDDEPGREDDIDPDARSSTDPTQGTDPAGDPYSAPTPASSATPPEAAGSPATEPMPQPPASYDDGPGQHRATRPVPRSGLSETNSASYLTAERDEAGESEPTTALPTPEGHETDPWAGEGVAATTAVPQPAAPPPVQEAAGSDTGVILEGATTAAPRSRVASHLWSVVLTLVLTPIAYFLVTDSGQRLLSAEPLSNGFVWQAHGTPVLELAAGLLAVTIVLLIMRASSLGAILIGSLITLMGLAYIALGHVLEPFITRALDTAGDVLWQQVAVAWERSLQSGQLLLYGVVLLMAGIAAAGARSAGLRFGRAERRHPHSRPR